MFHQDGPRLRMRGDPSRAETTPGIVGEGGAEFPFWTFDSSRRTVHEWSV